MEGSGLSLPQPMEGSGLSLPQPMEGSGPSLPRPMEGSGLSLPQPMIRDARIWDARARIPPKIRGGEGLPPSKKWGIFTIPYPFS